MNVKTLFATTLVFASLTLPAIAETLGEHPAVIVARTWTNRGIDPNTFIVLHPAGQQLQFVSSTEKDKARLEQAQRTANAGNALK
jgi:hypothetical protein